MIATLRLQAAQYAIGLLDTDRVKATLESLVDAGVYEDSFLPALVEAHPTRDDVRPGFLAALAHHGLVVPDKNTALWTLAEHHLRRVAATPSDALFQLGRFVNEVYWHCQEFMEDTTYVGDSHRLSKLLGLYWHAGDLRDRQVVTVNGHEGPQAWAEIDRLIVAEAERWLADFEAAGDSSAPTRSATP